MCSSQLLFPSDASVNFLTTLYGEYRDLDIYFTTRIEKSLLPNLFTFKLFSFQKDTKEIIDTSSDNSVTVEEI